MTDLLTHPAPSLAPPRLGDGVELLGEYQSSGFIEQKFLLRRLDGQVVQVSHLLYLVAAELDGRRDAQAIADAVSKSFGRPVSAANVTYLLNGRLKPLGLVQPDEGEDSIAPVATPLFALGLRAAFFPARLVKAATQPLMILFRRPVVCAALAGMVALDIWLFFIRGVNLQDLALQVLDNPLVLAVLVGAGFVTGIWHELGHSTACRYGGASPGRIGLGVFLIWPCFYSDVTDTYRLDRTGRLRTDLGGVYFQAIGVLIAAAAYTVTGFEPLLLLIVLEQGAILQQGLPFLRLDGYYVVSDLVGVPDLFGRIGPILKSLRPGAEPNPMVTELRPRVRVVVTAWVIAATVVLSAGLVFCVSQLPTWVGKSVDRFSSRFNDLSATLGDGNYLGSVVNFVQAATILVPVFGMALMVTRLRKMRRTQRAAKAEKLALQGSLAGSLAMGRPTSTSGGAFVPMLLGVAGALGLGAALVQTPWVYALAVPAACSIAVLWIVLRWTATGESGDRSVARWTYACYFLHLALSLGVSASTRTAELFGGAPGQAHLAAVAIVRHWSNGTPLPTLRPGEAGFTYGLARLYQVVGQHQVAGLAFTSLCSALVVVLVADTTRRLFGHRSRLAVLPLLVLLPAPLLWGPQLLAQAPMLVFVVLGANLVVRLSQEFRPVHLLLLGATLGAAFSVRPTMAYVMGAALVVGLALAGRYVTAAVAAVAAGPIAVALVLVLGVGVGSAGFEPASVSRLSSRLPQLLLGIGSSQATGLRQGLILLEVLTLVWMLPSLARGLTRGYRLVGRQSWFLLAPALAFAVILSLMSSSSGTLAPEGLQVLVLLLPFAALGRERRPVPRPQAAPQPVPVAPETPAPLRELQPSY